MEPFLGGNHGAKLNDGDEYFDLDDLEHAFEFGENERVSPVAGFAKDWAVSPTFQ